MTITIICNSNCTFSEDGKCNRENVLMLETENGVVICDDYVPPHWEVQK